MERFEKKQVFNVPRCPLTAFGACPSVAQLPLFVTLLKHVACKMQKTQLN